MAYSKLFFCDELFWLNSGWLSELTKLSDRFKCGCLLIPVTLGLIAENCGSASNLLVFAVDDILFLILRSANGKSSMKSSSLILWFRSPLGVIGKLCLLIGAE